MRRFLEIFTIILCIGTTVFTGYDGSVKNESGKYSAGVGSINVQTQKFIEDEFSDAESPEELIAQIGEFSLQNFVYDKSALKGIQTSDTNHFVLKKNFRGVCLDFSLFVKTVFCTISELKNWNNVGCYVALGNKFSSVEGHALNYITVKNEDGYVTFYELDTTYNLNYYLEGERLNDISFSAIINKDASTKEVLKNIFKKRYSMDIAKLI